MEDQYYDIQRRTKIKDTARELRRKYLRYKDKKKEFDEFLREEEDFDLDYFGDEFWDEDLDDDDDEVVTVSPEIAEKVAKYHEAAECLLEELENGTYGN